MAKSKLLSLRFLGEIDVVRGDERLDLPPSKKTRALLAYLVISGRSHRRERLCSLLWDITDDPRGALRWSLSKLRPLIDEAGKKRILSNRENIEFAVEGASVDAFEVRRCLAADVRSTDAEQLKNAVALFRGEFLEGLELPDFQEFQSWYIAEREEFRKAHVTLLDALVERLSPTPEQALPFARTRALLDPLNETFRASLVTLLGLAGRPREAEQQYEAGCRLLKEVGEEGCAELRKAWKEIPRVMPVASAAAAGSKNFQTDASAPANRIIARRESAPSVPPQSTTALDEPSGGVAELASDGNLPFVGRTEERERLIAILDETMSRRRERVILIKGEPGVGKTRLLAELLALARERRATVLDGCAYEAECLRPYGLWIDALHRLPALAVGTTIGTDLAPILPELPRESDAPPSRDRLFGAVVELIAARAHSAAPVLLAMDDVQWCDAASAELLHYVARMNRHRPLLVVLAARAGEIPDNDPLLRLIRGLRRDGLLEELAVGPLSRDETQTLVRNLTPDADPELIFRWSAGNPLFALEIARARPDRGHGLSSTLTEIICDRISRVPAPAVEVLRWGAVLGCAFSVHSLKEICSIDFDSLMSALEILERQALLHSVGSGREAREGYSFSHDVVRRAVYTDISEPRRRLMHRRIAQILNERVRTDETLAGGIAHHAALAGDFSMAACACVTAGQRCLRIFANSEADKFARRGRRYAEKLPEPNRVKLMLELLRISCAARRPKCLEETALMVEKLAEQALDYGCMEHARLGFHMVSYLHWETGDWSAAQRQTLLAEKISRSADEKERIVGLAEAARCLAMLERDLVQAEALALEAGALSARARFELTAIPDAIGMLRLHQGRIEEAAQCFQNARDLAHRDRDGVGEFQALEHLVILELQRERYGVAKTLADELIVIGDKLREGSEAPFARVLASIAHYGGGSEDVLPQLDESLQALRRVDAKYRLAFALTRTAEIDILRGRPQSALTRAEEALQMAQLLGRPSELALARVTLARAAAVLHDDTKLKLYRHALALEPLQSASAHARRVVQECLRAPILTA